MLSNASPLPDRCQEFTKRCVKHRKEDLAGRKKPHANEDDTKVSERCAFGLCSSRSRRVRAVSKSGRSDSSRNPFVSFRGTHPWPGGKDPGGGALASRFANALNRPAVEGVRGIWGHHHDVRLDGVWNWRVARRHKPRIGRNDLRVAPRRDRPVEDPHEGRVGESQLLRGDVVETASRKCHQQARVEDHHHPDL
eukprot:266059-Prorocentrum_minimum.AAC.3